MNAQAKNKWRQENKHLFYKYASEWVAFSPEKGILAHNSSRKVVTETLLATGHSRLDYIMEYIHPYEVVRPKRILPIRIKAVKRHEWTPKYPIILKRNDIQLEERMLIDSGADISVISKQTGIDLGLSVLPEDYQQSAEGVGGGSINYLTKVIHIEIDNQALSVPVAWLLDEDFDEMIIGREVVFDVFDIEFKQADEEIIFKKRADYVS
jgi:Aspartyl protease